MNDLELKVEHQLRQIQRREKRIERLKAEVNRLQAKVDQLVENCPYRQRVEDLEDYVAVLENRLNPGPTISQEQLERDFMEANGTGIGAAE